MSGKLTTGTKILVMQTMINHEQWMHYEATFGAHEFHEFTGNVMILVEIFFFNETFSKNLVKFKPQPMNLYIGHISICHCFILVGLTSGSGLTRTCSCLNLSSGAIILVKVKFFNCKTVLSSGRSKVPCQNIGLLDQHNSSDIPRSAGPWPHSLVQEKPQVQATSLHVKRQEGQEEQT